MQNRLTRSASRRPGPGARPLDAPMRAGMPARARDSRSAAWRASRRCTRSDVLCVRLERFRAPTIIWRRCCLRMSMLKKLFKKKDEPVAAVEAVPGPAEGRGPQAEQEAEQQVMEDVSVLGALAEGVKGTSGRIRDGGAALYRALEHEARQRAKERAQFGEQAMVADPSFSMPIQASARAKAGMAGAARYFHRICQVYILCAMSWAPGVACRCFASRDSNCRSRSRPHRALPSIGTLPHTRCSGGHALKDSAERAADEGVRADQQVQQRGRRHLFRRPGRRQSLRVGPTLLQVRVRRRGAPVMLDCSRHYCLPLRPPPNPTSCLAGSIPTARWRWTWPS